MKKQNWYDLEPFEEEKVAKHPEKPSQPKDWFEEESFDPAADLPVLLRTLDAAMAHRRQRHFPRPAPQDIGPGGHCRRHAGGPRAESPAVASALR